MAGPLAVAWRSGGPRGGCRGALRHDQRTPPGASDQQRFGNQIPPPKLTFKWAQKGRGLRRWADKASKRVETASVRATNKAGRWGRTQVKREVTKLLNIPQKELRSTERRASSRKRPVYRYTIHRREYPIRELRGVRFHAYAGGEGAGKLTFRAYGKKIVLKRVIKKTGGKGDKYLLLPKVASGRPKRVMGPWVKRDYREPKRIKREIPKRFKKEFRRQMAMLKKRGR